MIITRVKIKNFKSIKEIEIPFDKVGNSFTKIFVGINESGKSNVLEALSLFNPPTSKIKSFDDYCNQKMENSLSCDILFSLSLEDSEKDLLQNYINKNCISSEYKIDFSISNITKAVSLFKDASHFTLQYDFDVIVNEEDLYISKQKTAGRDIISVVGESQKTSSCELLTNENFKEYLRDSIEVFFTKNEPSVSFWKPSSEYLLSDANLNEFKKNVELNKPLCNIFKLSGYENETTIKGAVDKISSDRSRSQLVSKLNDSLNEYINKVWSNNIDLIIEITETGRFSLLIRDKGKDNIHDRFSITERSQGAQHFLSLILSLSLETQNHERKNELILIDEPEVHLHPSGIRDLAKELLKIGRDNYVFIATHSPFMVDKNPSHRKRHFIVKKNKKAITELKRIKDSDNLVDDEVLRDAFGIDVYRDLLNPYSILVEGASDKIILQKAFNCIGENNIGVTNGHGSNITTLASKLNYDNLSVIVVLDDDESGQKNKKSILKIGGIYNENNVFTIRDLVGDIIPQGTIEDTLDNEFVKKQFEKFYKETYKENLVDFKLESTQPIIKQITEFLKKNKAFNEWDMDAFKKCLSEEFNPNKSSSDTKNPLLMNLAKKIIKKIKL